MSHVAEIELEIKDLNALKEAARMLGMEFRQNQKTYRWFGTSVGDFPMPAGFTAADLGHCEHALSIGNDSRAYEIGVCKRRDGKAGYTLLWDFWQGGYGLEAKVGAQGNKLRDQYSAALSAAKLRKQGFRVQRSQTSDGKIVLRATR